MDGPFAPLNEGDVDPDPFAQFGRWFEEAAALVAAPEAMAVASATADGRPSVRMVLLKAWDTDGFVFYTDRESRKGAELKGNPRAALMFYWEPLGRQIRIEGSVDETSDDNSAAYFASRPRGAQLSAAASHQSQTVAGRDRLMARVAQLEAEYAGREVPRPARWGGLRVRPERFEFWQNRQDRLHDRLLYVPTPAAWQITRLQP
jgi:pyridoxamine 5'-phosphate oxidase